MTQEKTGPVVNVVHVFSVESSIFKKPPDSTDRSFRSAQIQAITVNLHSEISLVLDELIRVVHLVHLIIRIVAVVRSLHLAPSNLFSAARLGQGALGDSRGLLRGLRGILPAHLD